MLPCMRAPTWFRLLSSRLGWPPLRIVRTLPKAVSSRPLRSIQHPKRRSSISGCFYYTQNDFKPAISPLQTAQKLSPKSPLPVFYLAMTREALGDQTKALELYQQAENLSPQKSPQSAEILVAYGRFLLSLGRTQDSIEKDRRAIESIPSPAMRTMNWQRD